MGSATHIQGSPQRPGLVNSTDERAILARNQEQTADVRPAIYIRPLGKDMHLVRNECNPQPYRVNSLIPGATFSPGSVVRLVSNTGHPGESILGGPPVGQRGGSRAIAVPGLRPVEFDVSDPDLPPALVGFFFVSGTGTGILRAYNYSGGTQGDLINEQTTATFGTVNVFVLVSYSPLAVALRDSSNRILVWNVDDNTLVTVTGHPATGFSFTSFVYGGDGFAYFLEKKTSVDKFRLHQIAPDGTVTRITGGTDTLPSTWNGNINNHLFYDGDAGFLVMGGNPGDAGIIKVPADGSQPFIIVDSSFLPGDPAAGDWALYQGGHRLSGPGYALAINLPLDTIQGATSVPSAVDVIASYDDPDENTSLLPSPDGSQFLVAQVVSGPLMKVAVASPGDAQEDLVFYTMDDPGPDYVSFAP